MDYIEEIEYWHQDAQALSRVSSTVLSTSNSATIVLKSAQQQCTFDCFDATCISYVKNSILSVAEGSNKMGER